MEDKKWETTKDAYIAGAQRALEGDKSAAFIAKYKGLVQEQNEAQKNLPLQPLNPWIPPAQPRDVCPGCGHCNVCGRSRPFTAPYQYPYPAPWYQQTWLGAVQGPLLK